MNSVSRQKETLYRKLGPLCHYCLSHMVPASATVDHIVPRMFGGPSAMWNMVLACGQCNGGKGAKVGMCECERCRKALNRFNMTRPRVVTTRPHGGVRKPKQRTLDEAVRRITSRVEGARTSLDGLAAQDPMIAASIRGYAHGLQTALDVLRTVVEGQPEPRNRPTVATTAARLAYTVTEAESA